MGKLPVRPFFESKHILVAICCLGHWSFEQALETYALTEAECVGCLAELSQRQ